MRALSVRIIGAVLLVVAATQLRIAGTRASAETLAFAQSSFAVTSARWAAVASNSRSPAGTGPLALPLSATGTGQYFWAVNTGTTDLGTAVTSVGYSVSTSAALGVGSIQLRACVGAGATWNETTDLCTGGSVQVLADTTVAGLAGTVVPAAPGSALRLQIRGVSLPAAVTAVVTIAVSRQ